VPKQIASLLGDNHTERRVSLYSSPDVLNHRETSWPEDALDLPVEKKDDDRPRLDGFPSPTNVMYHGPAVSWMLSLPDLRAAN
jgi:hypothetical protein